MEKKLPEFKPLPELGNVASNYMSAFNVGMNIYEALAYLQGYVQITYNSVNDLIDDWNNFEKYITENINQIVNEKTQEILNQWLSDGTLAETIKQSDVWNEKVNKAGDVMSGDLQFQENTGVYGTLHSGDKVNMISHTYTGSDDYTQIGDTNAQSVVRSKARPVWYDGSQNQDLLVEEDLPPKENLLDNADFKSGIINQRGFEDTTITGWSKKATVDRWIFSGSNNATAEIYTNSMGIVGDCSLIQTLSQQYPSGTYTVAANIIALTGTLKISLIYSDDTTVDATISDTGLFVHTFAAIKAVKAVMFRCVGSGSSFAFDSIKLEKGSFFTGMPVWEYTNEWNNCRRFYKEVRVMAISINPTNVAQQYYMIPYIGDVPMPKKPTLVNAGQNGFVASWGGTPISNLNIVSLGEIDIQTNTPVRIMLNMTDNQAILQVILKLDAETY